jgi:hypothetical protein
MESAMALAPEVLYSVIYNSAVAFQAAEKPFALKGHDFTGCGKTR